MAYGIRPLGQASMLGSWPATPQGQLATATRCDSVHFECDYFVSRSVPTSPSVFLVSWSIASAGSPGDGFLIHSQDFS